MPARRSTRQANKKRVTAEEVFEVGEKCLCFNGLRLFTAHIVSIQQEEDAYSYTVHYLGWNARFDENVPIEHLVKMDHDGLAYQQELEAAYQAAEAAKKSEQKEEKSAAPTRAKPAKAKAKTPKGKGKATTAPKKAVRKSLPNKPATLIVTAAEVLATVEESTEKSTNRQFEAKLRKAFYHFDEDSSNSIDRDELRKMLRSMGRRCSRQKLDQLFAVLDENGDGSIEFHEFLRYFKEKHTETDDQKYCTCEGVYDGRFMLACDGGLDGCKEWFHGDCVGVQSAAEVANVVWFCPACTAAYPKELKRASDVLVLNGHKYSRPMLAAARIAHTQRGEITLEDAKLIVGDVLRDGRYALVEKATMKYIRAQFQFTVEADAHVRHAIASNASKKAARTKKTNQIKNGGAIQEAASSTSSSSGTVQAADAKIESVTETAPEEATEAGEGEAMEVENTTAATTTKKRKASESVAQNSAVSTKRVKGNPSSESKVPTLRRTTSLLSREALDVMAQSKDLKQTAFVTETNRAFTAQLRRVFRRVDTDGNGRLSRTELKVLMRSLGRRPLHHKIEAIFTALDLNEDGDIDFDEFLKYFRSKHTEVDTRVYCSCQTPSDGRLMIQCEANFEGCAEWYHCECVDLQDEELPEVWFCTSCRDLNPDKVALLTSTIKIKNRTLDRNMYTLAMTAQTDHKTLTLDDAKAMLEAVLEDGTYSTIEKRTMQYLRENCAFSTEADAWLRSKIRQFASQQGALTRASRREVEVKTPKQVKEIKAAAAKEDLSTATTTLVTSPNGITASQIEAIRMYIVRWFATHHMKVIQDLATRVNLCSLPTILLLDKQAWKEAVGGDIFATNEIVGYLTGYAQQA